MQRKKEIKNPNDLKNIPKDKLFISESGYAYSFDEIADFIKCGATFKKYQYCDEVGGTFRDFKNNTLEPDIIRDNYCKNSGINRSNDLPLHMFTEGDLKILLNDKLIEAAFRKNEEIFDHLETAAYVLEKSDTLNLISEVAKASQVCTSIEMTDDVHVSQVVSIPIHNLAKNIEQLGIISKKILTDLTDNNGYLPFYYLIRRKSFIEDITLINNTNNKTAPCLGGLNICMANLHSVFVSHSLYQKVTLSLEAEKISVGQNTNSTAKIYSKLSIDTVASQNKPLTTSNKNFEQEAWLDQMKKDPGYNDNIKPKDINTILHQQLPGTYMLTTCDPAVFLQLSILNKNGAVCTIPISKSLCESFMECSTATELYESLIKKDTKGNYPKIELKAYQSKSSEKEVTDLPQDFQIKLK